MLLTAGWASLDKRRTERIKKWKSLSFLIRARTSIHSEIFYFHKELHLTNKAPLVSLKVFVCQEQGREQDILVWLRHGLKTSSGEHLQMHNFSVAFTNTASLKEWPGFNSASRLRENLSCVTSARSIIAPFVWHSHGVSKSHSVRSRDWMRPALSLEGEQVQSILRNCSQKICCIF